MSAEVPNAVRADVGREPSAYTVFKLRSFGIKPLLIAPVFVGKPRSLLVVALMFQLSCAQYLGYHYAPLNAEKQGMPRERLVVTRERVDTYAKYSPQDDLKELVLWILGLPIGVFLMEGDPVTHNWLYRPLCLWPPFDLIARLFGDYGVNKDYKYALGSPGVYDKHPPGYFRRLAQWLGWVVPGYNVFHYPKFERYVIVHWQRVVLRYRCLYAEREKLSEEIDREIAKLADRNNEIRRMLMQDDLTKQVIRNRAARLFPEIRAKLERQNRMEKELARLARRLRAVGVKPERLLRR